MIFNAGSNYPNSGVTYGSISLGGNGSYNLSPLSSGTYAGIVIFQPKDNTNTLSVSGNASGMTGTIYASAAQLNESGNGQLNAGMVQILGFSGITPARKFRMLLHTNPTRERGECLGTRAGASEDM